MEQSTGEDLLLCIMSGVPSFGMVFTIRETEHFNFGKSHYRNREGERGLSSTPLRTEHMTTTPQTPNVYSHAKLLNAS